MTWWQALILGVVEGLTEYLPVSSTGHLILAQWILGKGQDPAVNSFLIVIQAGAIAAVLGLYRGRVQQMVLGLVGRDDAGRRLVVNLLIAFVPAAVLGPLFAERIEQALFAPGPVIAALFVGAWLMLVTAMSGVGKRASLEIEQLQAPVALLIGFGQCIAMWPGVSRSMVTIVAALLLGMRPRAAAEFSFLLGLVTLTGATCYKAWYDGAQMINDLGWSVILVGTIAAALSAAVAIKWFVSALTRFGLAPFGWYRLALATVLAVLSVTGDGFSSPDG